MDDLAIAESGNPVTLHQKLVDKLKSDGVIRSAAVERAFRAVPRHLFLPDRPVEQVYRDAAIPIKHQDGVAISSSSQPAIMAIMLEQLGLEPGMRVLEIGAGSGYNAALLAEIVGTAGQVATIDLDDDLVAGARAHLTAAGFDRVRVVCADGAFGDPEGAPFDRIMLTVGSWDVAPAWREQLAPKGRLVLPLKIRFSELSVAFEAAGGHLTSVSAHGCGFMTLRGAGAAPPRDVSLGLEPGLTLAVDDSASVDADATFRLLTGPHQDRPTGLEVSTGALWEGLSLWLSLREPALGQLFAQGGIVRRDLVPYLFGYEDWWRSTLVLRTADSLCALVRHRPADTAGDAAADPPVELLVRQFGPDGALADRLIAACRGWDAGGRLGMAGLRIRAYPTGAAYAPRPGELALTKRWNHFVFDWPDRHALTLHNGHGLYNTCAR